MYLYLMYSIQVHSDSLCFCIYCTPFRPWNSWEIVCWGPPRINPRPSQMMKRILTCGDGKCNLTFVFRRGQFATNKKWGKVFPPGKGSHIQPGENENHRLKSDGWDGIVPSRVHFPPKKWWQKNSMPNFPWTNAWLSKISRDFLLGTSAMSFSCFCLCFLDVVTSHELIPNMVV